MDLPELFLPCRFLKRHRLEGQLGRGADCLLISSGAVVCFLSAGDSEDVYEDDGKYGLVFAILQFHFAIPT
jgi:hypothetical protein